MLDQLLEKVKGSEVDQTDFSEQVIRLMCDLRSPIQPYSYLFIVSFLLCLVAMALTVASYSSNLDAISNKDKFTTCGDMQNPGGGKYVCVQTEASSVHIWMIEILIEILLEYV